MNIKMFMFYYGIAMILFLFFIVILVQTKRKIFFNRPTVKAKEGREKLAKIAGCGALVFCMATLALGMVTKAEKGALRTSDNVIIEDAVSKEQIKSSYANGVLEDGNHVEASLSSNMRRGASRQKAHTEFSSYQYKRMSMSSTNPIKVMSDNKWVLIAAIACHAISAILVLEGLDQRKAKDDSKKKKGLFYMLLGAVLATVMLFLLLSVVSKFNG